MTERLKISSPSPQPIRIHRDFAWPRMMISPPLDAGELTAKVRAEFAPAGDWLIGELNGHDAKSLAAALTAEFQAALSARRDEIASQRAETISTRRDATTPKPDNLPAKPDDLHPKPDNLRRSVAELAAQRLAVCEKCSDSVRRSKCNGKHGGVTCRLMFDGHYMPCQFAAYLKRPSASCPKQTTQQWGL